MSPAEAKLLRRHGYEREGSVWVHRIPARVGLRVELLCVGALPRYRIRAVASESHRWYSGLLVDRLHDTLGAALADPGLAALEAAVCLGATLEDLGRRAW